MLWYSIRKTMAEEKEGDRERERSTLQTTSNKMYIYLVVSVVKKRGQARRANTSVAFCLNCPFSTQSICVYVSVSFLIKFDDTLNEKDAINLKRSSIMCRCGCICMCNSLSPIVRRHHHLDLHFYGLVIVASERMKAQYTMQLNTASASRSVYIHIYIHTSVVRLKE